MGSFALETPCLAMTTRLTQAVVVVASLVPACVQSAFGQRPTGAEPSAEIEQRVYETGPLTPRDFQAAIPEDDRGLDAWTTSDLTYRYRYEARIVGRRATARVTQVDIEAVVIPGESWNRQPENLSLLDHEQGHFDLTQIAALKARLHFAQQRISRSAATAAGAVRSIESELQQKMGEFLDELKRQHEQYDRLTNHGRVVSRQLEQRGLQQEQLASLTQKWQDFQVPGSSPPKIRSGRKTTQP